MSYPQFRQVERKPAWKTVETNSNLLFCGSSVLVVGIHGMLFFLKTVDALVIYYLQYVY